MPTAEPAKLTPDEATALAAELPQLRLRAEHGLLKRLVELLDSRALSPEQVSAGAQALAAITPPR